MAGRARSELYGAVLEHRRHRLRLGRTTNGLLYLASWLVLAGAVFAGIGLIPNATAGGAYSGTDGEWARWNSASTLVFSSFLDVSPFNAFAGMGSVFVPNLPWLSPGALMLALPLDPLLATQLSFLVYMLELGASLVLLGRALGLSWGITTIAAQFHILLFFPPFSAFFQPMEWYSAAPVYAQITSVLNVAMAAFIAIGQARHAVTVLAFVSLPVVGIIGLLSAPFSFVFFLLPYIALGVVVLLLRPGLRTVGLRLAALVVVVVVLIAIGYPDYLRAMAGTSARTPPGSINWTAMLSLDAWRGLIGSIDLCADPRTMICPGNPVAWVQVLGLAGALVLTVSGRGLARALGVWGLLYTATVFVYAYLYASGWLGPLSSLSIHFVSWSSYPLLGLCIIGGGGAVLGRIWPVDKQEAPPLHWWDMLGIAAALAMAYAGLTFTGNISGFVLLIEGLPRAASIAIEVAFLALLLGAAATILRCRGRPTPAGLGPWLSRAARVAVPALAFTLMPALWTTAQQLRQPARGPILEYLDRHASLALGQRFRGYTATIWSPAVDPHNTFHRYVAARAYFDRHYGNTFGETDLWTSRIPTYEEYGQWVSRQVATFSVVLMGTEEAVARPEGRLLRLYVPDYDLLRALGVRFLITDAEIPAAEGVLRASESAPGALPVHLYELNDANLATYSPTEIVASAEPPLNILDAVEAHAGELARFTVTSEQIAEPLVPMQSAEMRLTVDGYRIGATSTGRSALLLPIQFSNCLQATAVSGEAPRLVRANFLQTLLVFSGEIDVTITNGLGLGSKAQCGLEDVAFASSLP